MIIRILCFVAFVLIPAIGVSEVADLPGTASVDGGTLVLNGSGVRKATILRIKVYEAGLYLREKNQDAEKILEQSGLKQLVMRFLRDVSGEKVLSTWKESLSANNTDAERWLPRLEELTDGLGEVKEGEKLTLTLDENSARLESSGGFSQEVSDPGFSKALLRIWIGSVPPDEDLKKGLLGGS